MTRSPALAILFGTLCTLAVLDGCSAVRPACTVIDLAHQACGAFVQVRLENGELVSVPVSDIRMAAKRTQELQKGGAK
jgi:hypothetical protein